ncbi:glutathione S-transferase family protein [Halioxenophilus sp. WMMB6]|uniref:glutathione S-transferase family protein n=1 Tax=Halioxenophilus sp. WMMB6 TaxID=3073815 RepID=UPI00295F495E|nr:glutathione S-transferase family protein [Halioxenophilus sp. WMMB6]
MKLVIGNKNYSSWSLRPWLLLSAHKIPFQEVRIPLYQANSKTQLAQYSDVGLVPVLHDNSLVVWDSLAICEYVSERYLHGRGWPENYQARAQARACSAEMHSGFTTIRNQLPMNCRASGRQVPLTDKLLEEIARIDRMWAQYRHHNSAHGPWLFGCFSIADCMYAPMALRFNSYGVQLSNPSQEYLQTLLNHPAMQSWLAAARQEPEVIADAEIGQITPA